MHTCVYANAYPRGQRNFQVCQMVTNATDDVILFNNGSTLMSGTFHIKMNIYIKFNIYTP